MPPKSTDWKGVDGYACGGVSPDFAAVVDNDPDAFVLFDNEARFLYLNPAGERMFGRSEDLLGKVLWEKYPVLIGTPLHDALTHAITEGIPLNRDHPSVLTPGAWYDVRCVPYDGSCVGLYARDITEKKQREAEREQLLRDLKAERDALRLSEERLRTIGDTVPFGIWMMGTDGLARYVSQSFLDLVGMTLAEGRAYRWLTRVAPEDRELIEPRWRHSLETGEPWKMEYHIDGVDGRRYAILSQGLPVRDDEGQITSWVGFSLDITERKQAEEALQAREALLRAVLETLPVGVWIADARGEILQHNLAVRRLWEVESLEGHTIEEFHAWDSETGKKIGPEEWGLVKALTKGQTTLSETLEIQTFTGGRKTIQASAVPVRDTKGQIIGAVATNLDITARVKAEKQLEEMLLKQSRIADTLQRSLLLVPPPNTFPGLTVKPIYEAARDDSLVGGDFYDLFSVAEDKVALVVGDVTGKGLDAAVYTAEVKFALRAFLRENPDPAQAMERLNQFIIDSQRYDSQLRGATYVVISVVVLDTRTGDGICSSAGIEPPFVVHAATNEAETIAAGGMMLGAMPNVDYELGTLHLDPGDLLVMFTDGLTEARHGKKFFGYEGVVRSVLEMAHLPSLAKMGQSISDRARDFSGGLQHDDVCLLLARRVAPDEPGGVATAGGENPEPEAGKGNP